jgi:hypothetical protein
VNNHCEYADISLIYALFPEGSQHLDEQTAGCIPAASHLVQHW